MESFKRYWQEPGKGVEHRHLKDVVPDANSHPQHPGRTVPEYVKEKMENLKVKQLKNQQTGKVVLNVHDVKQIEDEFNLKFDNTQPKRLGNTGIVIKFDPHLNSAVLQK